MPDAAFTSSPIQTDMLNPDIHFYNQSGNCASAQWWFGDLATSSQLNPSHTYLAPGTYPVTLVVESAKNCFDTVVQDIVVYDIFTFYAPTAFSPNGDGFNDVFLPMGAGWEEGTFKMVIYDRWGTLIESTTNPAKGWDGTQKGEDAQEDTYVWKVELKDNFLKPHQYWGVVNLIR
jgi:gliding motility-associated-like protein